MNGEDAQFQQAQIWLHFQDFCPAGIRGGGRFPDFCMRVCHFRISILHLGIGITGMSLKLRNGTIGKVQIHIDRQGLPIGRRWVLGIHYTCKVGQEYIKMIKWLNISHLANHMNSMGYCNLVNSEMIVALKRLLYRISVTSSLLFDNFL